MALQLVSLPVPLAITGWHLGYISFELFKEESPVMADNVSALCIREKGCFGGFLMSQNTSRIYKRVLTLHALLAPVTICLQGEIWWWQFYSEAHRSQHLTNDTCWTEQEWVPGNRNSIKKAGHCQLWAVLHTSGNYFALIIRSSVAQEGSFQQHLLVIPYSLFHYLFACIGDRLVWPRLA